MLLLRKVAVGSHRMGPADVRYIENRVEKLWADGGGERKGK
jgi:hypothetical protein